MIRIFLVLFLFIALGGCTTASRKQAAQVPAVNHERSSAYQQEIYQDDYDDVGVSDIYEKPSAKTYAEQSGQLSSKQIQRALENAGFYLGPIDGKIGPKTKEAIMKFQKVKGLKADGIVGKKTSAELNKYLNK